MDWTQYWFMFPIAICVATSAMLSGIGGAALFIQIFIIIFPLLGPDYPLSTSAAIGSALMTEVFGFSSGFIGYYRKRLIDFRSALPFISVSVPTAITGALLFGILQEQDNLLKAIYAALMILLSIVIMRHTPASNSTRKQPATRTTPSTESILKLVSRDGQEYQYSKPKQGLIGGFFTSIGSFLTGFLGVGVGEVILPQLVKRNHVPVAVAAATSVCYTIPAVIIGGQIGPLLQGRIPQRKLEKAIAILFSIIGISMGWIAIANAN